MTLNPNQTAALQAIAQNPSGVSYDGADTFTIAPVDAAQSAKMAQMQDVAPPADPVTLSLADLQDILVQAQTDDNILNSQIANLQGTRLGLQTLIILIQGILAQNAITE